MRWSNDQKVDDRIKPLKIRSKFYSTYDHRSLIKDAIDEHSLDGGGFWQTSGKELILLMGKKCRQVQTKKRDIFCVCTIVVREICASFANFPSFSVIKLNLLSCISEAI